MTKAQERVLKKKNNCREGQVTIEIERSGVECEEIFQTHTQVRRVRVQTVPSRVTQPQLSNAIEISIVRLLCCLVELKEGKKNSTQNRVLETFDDEHHEVTQAVVGYVVSAVFNQTMQNCAASQYSTNKSLN